MSESANAARRPVFPAAPAAEYLADGDAIREAVHRVLDHGHYILGEEVEAFEREFAAFLGIGHAVGVGSGTEALHLALRVLGIGPGDTVITVAHTAVATVSAIELAGARPVFVDIDPDTYTMAPARVESAIRSGRNAKALIPVHLYGHAADMPAIMEIARRHGLAVIEDCAQSHGAMCHGRMTGTWGDLATFSFYPTKNLGAIGDGGALVTDHPEFAQRAKALRQYGWVHDRVSAVPGMNSRLDEIQAAVLRIKLRTLAESNQRRAALAARYDALLAATPLVLPRRPADGHHVFHQYVVRSERRDAMKTFLQKHDVHTQIHYPVPVHLQPAYERLGVPKGSLPVTEQTVAEILSLPVHPGVSKEEVEWICARLVRWHDETPFTS
jgi:dTDP-4-amino-4,6-dideoxygalactose transaminase